MELNYDIQKLVNTLETTHLESVDGQTMVILNINELQVIQEFIISILKIKTFQPTIKFRIFILESVLKNKKNNDLNSYKLNTLLLQLLKILALDLTLNDVDYSNFWNCLVKDSLNKLWLPEKTDSVDSDSIFLNGNSNKTLLNSWFSTHSTSPQKKNLQKTYLPFYKYLHPDRMEKRNVLLRTKKIKLKLTSIQKAQLENWRHSCRYSYNKAIWLINDTDSSYSNYDLRNLITPAEVNSRTKWLLETPTAIREAAVFEANKNKNACFTNYLNKNIKHFKLKFISRKKESWTIGGFNNVKKISNNIISLYPKYNFGQAKTTEQMPDTYKTCSIHFDGIHYYILVPVETELKKYLNKNPIASLDPGVRTFNTLYDPMEEKCYKIGDGASYLIYQELLLLDKLISQRSFIKNANAHKGISCKISRKRLKIKNLQHEMHCKVSNWLCKKYNTIVIPRFDSKNMVSKNKSVKRVISTKTVRNMSLLAHGKFLEMLKTKAQEFQSELIIVDEIDTTKTCSKCLYKCNTIGAKEEWRCLKCKHFHDRDCNASKNILMKVY
jgi:transposase